MKISVITATYNSEQTLQDCIDSVKNQTHADIEHIIIDGASTDGTKNIIEENHQSLSKIVSEPDNGIYHAMNKGIGLATGEVIAILNSDDVYADQNILKLVAENFLNNPEIGIVYGDLLYVDRSYIRKIKRIWKSRPYINDLFRTGWHPPHPAFFVKREVYEKFGKFREDMSISADYELMLRFLEKNKVQSKYIPMTFVLMREGGHSNRSIKNIIKGNIQALRSWKVNGMKTPYLIFFKKPFCKIKQLSILSKNNTQ